MLDVENVKKILQAEVNKREKAKAKWQKYLFSDKSRAEFYERRYNMYLYRIDGMYDMLFDLGYTVWFDDNDVFVEKRVDDDIISTLDEIPF